MTHEQISKLVQINQSLGEIRANAAIALDEAKKAIERINDVVTRIEAEQQKLMAVIKSTHEAQRQAELHAEHD